MIRKDKKRSRIKAVQMDNLRGLLDIMRMDRVLNPWIRVRWSSERDVFHWFGHIERMKNDKIAKRVYVEECEGSHIVS